MSKRRAIRGVGGDKVEIVMLASGYVAVVSEWIEAGLSLSRTSATLSIKSTKQLHTALGELLAETAKRKARRR